MPNTRNLLRILTLQIAALMLATSLVSCSGASPVDNETAIATQTEASLIQDQQSAVSDDTNIETDNETDNEVNTLAPAVSPDNIPADCLLTKSSSEETFCYTQESRTLRAWARDGNEWWSFSLPGTDESNQIRAIQVVNGELIIVAENKQGRDQLGLELTAFSLGGEFQRTVALPSLFAEGSRMRIWASSIQVVDMNSYLIMAGHYGAFMQADLPRPDYGAFIAIFESDSGSLLTSHLYTERSVSGSLSIDESQITLPLDSIDWTVTPSNLELISAIDENQTIKFDRQNYVAQKNRIVDLIENPPLTAIAERMRRWYFSLDRASYSPTENIPCPGGGWVNHQFTSSGTGGDTRTISFDNCISANFTADGSFRKNTSDFCGRDCSGPSNTLSFTDFNVDFIDAESWRIDSSVHTEERRVNFSRETGRIDNPITNYENTTVINEFMRSDVRGTLTLFPGRYEYNARADSGTVNWSGSGTMSYANATSENFTVEMNREVRDGVQWLISGELMANRSDGTSLSVGVATENADKVLYTVNDNGAAVEFVENW